MSVQEEIKGIINELRNHFETNLNNKYVKNIILKLDIPLDIRHNMNILIDYKTLYFDSKGCIDDIYSSIKAITQFIKDIRVRVLPNIYSYSGNSFFSASGKQDPNDKILFQMAVKNYPMNIKILAKYCLNLLRNVIEYDKQNFPNDPAYLHVKNIAELEKYLEEILKDKNIKSENNGSM